MGLVHQIAPEDGDFLVLSHAMEEEGLVDGWITLVRWGHRPMVSDGPPDTMVILGSGEPSVDGEDFTFKKGGSEYFVSLPFVPLVFHLECNSCESFQCSSWCVL